MDHFNCSRIFKLGQNLIFCIELYIIVGGGELTQQSLPEELCSILSTHMAIHNYL